MNGRDISAPIVPQLDRVIDASADDDGGVFVEPDAVDGRQMAFQLPRRISRRNVPKKDVFIGAGGTYEGVVETTANVQHVVVVSLVRLEQEVFERTVESDASIGGRTEENVVTIRVESDGSDGAGFRL